MSLSGNCDPKDTALEGLFADLALLSTAVAEAGSIALRHFRNGSRQWQKGPGQIVTEADIEIDQTLHEILIGARPDDGWLSEERPDDGSRHRCKRVWVVDPIDGTRSFAEGTPEFTISVALVEGGRPVLASVFNPATEEHFQAMAGQGARLGAHPLKPSNHLEIEGAKLLVSSTETKKRQWPKKMPGAAFTTIGSLAYKLALVAAGRFDGLVSLRSSNDWDLAAAALLIQETGGWLGDASGQALKLNGPTMRHAGLVAAGTEKLYNSLVSQLENIRSLSHQN
ncbi:MAG: 3'(2'),5'-bisphosphate nucleotidase CysQ [Geminicoccaceae bacterium]